MITEEKSNYDTLESSFADAITSFNTQLDSAIEVEQHIASDLAVIGTTFDQATLSNRMNQLEQEAVKIDQKMNDFQSTVQLNNQLASQTHTTFTSNLGQVNTVKQTLSGLIGKLGKYNGMLATNMTKVQEK